MLRYLLFLPLLFIATKGFSQEPEKDSIDIALTKCLNDSVTTAGMCHCSDQAKDAYDKELNKYYNLLIKKLNSADKQDLIQAEKEWILYRDKEFKLIEDIYETEMQGTMWIPIMYDDEMEIVKTRAVELKAYYELLNENK